MLNSHCNNNYKKKKNAKKICWKNVCMYGNNVDSENALLLLPTDTSDMRLNPIALEWPKLYGVLAILSAKGLNKRIKLLCHLFCDLRSGKIIPQRNDMWNNKSEYDMLYLASYVICLILWAGFRYFDLLTLGAPVTTAADDIHKYFFIVSQRK